MSEPAIQEPCRLSARRAWHDVYFIPTPDKLEILQQHFTLGATISQIIFERAYDKVTRKQIIVGSHETISASQTPSKKPPGIAEAFGSPRQGQAPYSATPRERAVIRALLLWAVHG